MRRAAVVVRASAEDSRRAVLGGLLAGVAALAASPAANAIDIRDDRKARANGFDLIYEARDLDLPQVGR
jgi:photosystem II oxygen-evolving enhancer protein 3